MLKTSLNTFGNVFGHFENWKFSGSLKFFDFSTLQGALGEIFHRQKYLEACSKHVWLLLGTFFGHFEKLKVFPVFWNFSKFRRSRVHWAIFSKKNYLKTISKLVWTLLGSFLDTFEISNFCRFFFRINQKNYLKACSKRFWTFLGMYLGFLKKNESFSIFLTFFHVSTLQRALGKIFFQKNTSKQFQHLFEKLLRTFLDTFRNSIFFDFFRISTSFDLQVALVKKSSEKITSEEIWTLLETFFGILKKWIFFHFFEIFRFLYPPGCNEFFFLKQVWNFWERIWAFWKFFQFFEVFPSFPGCTGEKTSKQFQHLFEKLLRTFLDTFRNSIFFDFFRISTSFDLQVALVKNLKKTFGNVFRDFENFFFPEACWKQVPGNLFGHFWKRFGHFWKFGSFFPVFWMKNWKFFHFFEFFKHVQNAFRPSRVHWAKIFSKKVRNLFGNF